MRPTGSGQADDRVAGESHAHAPVLFAGSREDAAPVIGAEHLPAGRFIPRNGRLGVRRRLTEPLLPSGADAAAGAGAIDLVVPGLGSADQATSDHWRLLDQRAWPWVRAAVDLLLLIVVTAIVAAGAPGEAGSAPLWLYPVLPVALMSVRGLYVRRAWQTAVDAVFAAFGAVSIATMAYVTALAFTGREGGVELAAQLWVLSLAVVCAAHAGLLRLRRWAQRTQRVGARTLIVGAGEVGRRVARRLGQHPEYGLVPVGMVDVGPTPVAGDATPPLVGAPHELVQVAKWMRADHVVLAFPRIPDFELVRHIRHCEAAGLSVSLVPRLFETMNEKFEVQRLGALPLLALRSVDPRGWQFTLKYYLDRVVAAALLLVMLPVLLMIAATVRLTSPGPVFFRQRRVGLDGQVFDLLKFRSMYVDEEKEHFQPAPGLAPGGIEGNDRRTPVGRLLRRTFLDELPQLINVLRGEMSIVGPRPERPEYVELFVDEVARYGDRHRAKSGITGWAQVHGLRGQTSVVERIELDNHYIDNWSLGLDLKILLLTCAAVVSNKQNA